jgi:nucleotide-binding universal stress UspA family protein
MDGSPASQAAMEWAAEYAHGNDAEVLALHADGLLERFAARDETAESLEEELGTLAEHEWCTPLRRAGVLHETMICPGDPVERLLSVAAQRHVDLIVVGTRGALSSEAQRLGSTSHRVIECSPVPVLVVPPPP